MKRVRWECAALAALAVGLGASASRAASKEAVAGVVISMQGQPMTKPNGEKEFKKLKLNQFVYEKDVIKTAAGERAAVAFVGGAELRINESSEFVMQSGGGRKETSVFTQAGQAWTRLLHGRAGMRVGSPLAVAAVRGTEADVDVAARMTVKVYEGHVNVQNEFGKQDLKAGQMTQVAGGLAPEAPRQMGQGEYGTWQNGLQANGLDKNLKRLRKEADKNRTMELKYKKDDGTQGSVKIKLKKK